MHPTSSNLGYDPDAHATLDGWFDAVIADSVQAVTELNADQVSLSDARAAWLRHGWSVVDVDLRGLIDDASVHARLAEALRWPTFVSPSIDAWSEWLAIGLSERDPGKACLMVDARDNSKWRSRHRLLTAMHDAAKHRRSTYGKTFPEGGLCQKIVSFVWYESFAGREHHERDAGFTSRLLPSMPMRAPLRCTAP